MPGTCKLAKSLGCGVECGSDLQRPRPLTINPEGLTRCPAGAPVMAGPLYAEREVLGTRARSSFSFRKSLLLLESSRRA